ncbi:hypothetical protein DFH07DRAFT_1055072 [Mycena maculata]|uniref:F-box domain-containing protein n=1 Tax=Mycena maculata TaxID=230809 RepID=A0AAD7P1G9_9AGAR|nr:hypothetical protein DFH07DRAFT_1055072 [Mycena maculata]
MLWNLLQSAVSRKRSRPDSEQDTEEPPAKRHAGSRVFFPQPSNQRTMRKRFPASPERSGMEKLRDRSNVARRLDWFSDFVPPDAVCFCHAKNITFCICKQIAEGTSTLSGIPPEILHAIFDLVIPPENLLNPSLQCGPNSAWCNAMVTKRALVFVCRDWYLAGIDFLYRHIVIRRLADLFDLSDTLNVQPALGQLVRTITFMAFLPPPYYDHAYATVERILQRCPNVTSVNDLPPFCPLIRYPFPPLPATVTSLKIGPFDHNLDVLDVLRLSCGRLQELSLPAADDELFDAEALSFPHLHTLSLTIGSTSTTTTMRTFAAKWTLPRLQRLTFRVSVDLDPAHALSADYRHILALHGRRLTYLAFPGAYPRAAYPDDEDFGPLLALCPAVEHLVLPAYATVAAPATHPSVKWLDTWCPAIYDADAPAPAPSPCFPHAARRLLDCALAPHIADVPRALDPRVGGTWALAYPGLAVEQAAPADAGGVARVRLGDLRAAEDWDLSYFGAMELHVVEREQDHLDHGAGRITHDRHREFYSSGARELPGVRAQRAARGEVLAVDRAVPRRDDDVVYYLPEHLKTVWLEDETDDEDSDLESEDLAALDHDFDPEEFEPVRVPHYVPAPILPRASFPWLSLAFRHSIFPPAS